MKIIKSISLFVLCLLLCCCNNEEKKQVEKISERQNVPAKRSVPQTISIYRYEGVEKSKAVELAQSLKEYFPNVVVKEETIPLPPQYYNKGRNRYKGTGLLNDLARYRKGDAIIGLTDYVIYKANEKSPTYGIMGVSPVGTYKCVVSTKIPASGKKHTDSNLTKLALHELGHSFGLGHCSDQHCYMVDAEHKMKFPQTTGFCNLCRNKLNAKGWKIK